MGMDKYIHNKDDKQKLEALKNDPKSVKLWIRFYNLMCVKCKITHMKLQSRGRGITEDKLCSVCREKLYGVFR